MQHRKLGNTDLQVSVLGFGASPLGEEFGAIDAAEGERAVHHAIGCGINFFDTAPFYGRTLSEDRLGHALGGRRDKVILATKCCRYDLEEFDFSAKRVESSIDESLRRLRTDYVDLYQIHDIEFGDRRQIIEETIPAARRVRQSGKARYIGISGLQLDMLREVAAAAPVDSILSYARHNLMVRDLDQRLTPFVREHGIGLINAAPLHMRVLSEQGAPDWHPADPAVKDAGRKVVERCKARGVPVAPLALRFCLDHTYAACTLVGLASRAQVDENLGALEARLDPELMAEIEAIVDPVRDHFWPSGRAENQDREPG